MSCPVVTTTGDTSVVAAARAAALAHVRRLPVVDRAGLLVGIVTRSDLLRVFLPDDDEIRKHVVEQLAAEEFYLDPSAIDVAVHDGVVTLTGQVQRRLLIEPLLGAVRRMAGASCSTITAPQATVDRTNPEDGQRPARHARPQ